MALFRRIVVGLDLASEGEIAEGARLALDQARWLAGRGGVHVTLLHSTRPDEQWDEREGGYVARGSTPSDGRSRLESARESLRAAGVETDLVLTEEPAWLALVQEVLREPADLVITGKRSTRHGDGRPIGSVAAKLLRKCPCPVWVVKPGSASPPRVLLAATDLTRVGEIVIDLAARLAQEGSSDLHVVHALQLPIDVQMEGEAGVRAWLEKAREEATAKLREQLQAAGRGKDTIHIGLTSPSRAVLEGAARYAPDLVVMGTVSRGGIAGVLVGNTAERLLGCLDRSILAVKPPDFVCPVAPAPER